MDSQAKLLDYASPIHYWRNIMHIILLPEAIASNNAFDKPSVYEGSTKISKPARTLSISYLTPQKIILSSIPLLLAYSLSWGSNTPVPANTSFIKGLSCATSANEINKVRRFFSDENLPTNPMTIILLSISTLCVLDPGLLQKIRNPLTLLERV